MTKPSFKITFSPKNFFVFPSSLHRQFRRLMIVLLIAFIGTVAFHIYYFGQVESDSFFKPATTVDIGSAQVINQNKLDLVLQRFEDKKTTREGISTLTPPVAEPNR